MTQIKAPSLTLPRSQVMLTGEGIDGNNGTLSWARRRLLPHTFRTRLTLTMTALSVAVLAAMSATIYVGVSRTLKANLDRALLGITLAEAASTLDDPHQGVHVHEGIGILDPSLGAGYDKLAQIKDEHGRVVTQTANLDTGPSWQTDPRREADARAGRLSFGDVRRNGETYRAAYHPAEDHSGRKLSLVVAIPKRHLQHSLRMLFDTLALCLIAGVAFSVWGARRLARYLTRPLEQIAAAAQLVGEDNLSRRIPPVSADSELRRVTDRLNAMLGRLEAAFVAQQRLVADVSHELRTPLSNLRGTIEVTMRRTRSVEEYGETLSAALGEIERLSRLVDGLLTLSRADSGRLLLQSADCDLAAIAAHAAIAHQARAAGKRVEIRVGGDAPLMVSGDADRLRQVVDNLLDNALRHAPAGSEIVVETRRAGERACLSVSDRGPGLSLDEQELVFDRFYRTDAARARHSGGLGLGLSIAKTIAVAHGGQLTVSSRSGEGTTFTLALPASRRSS